MAGGSLCHVLLPLSSHSLEFLVHWLRHTPHLKASIISSMSFTAISTLSLLRNAARHHGSGETPRPSPTTSAPCRARSPVCGAAPSGVAGNQVKTLHVTNAGTRVGGIGTFYKALLDAANAKALDAADRAWPETRVERVGASALSIISRRTSLRSITATACCCRRYLFPGTAIQRIINHESRTWLRSPRNTLALPRRLLERADAGSRQAGCSRREPQSA